MKAAVIGSPVSHSLSPAIFRFIAQKMNVEMDYLRHHVEPGQLSSFLRNFRSQDYVGLNVTLPLKEEVMKECDSLSEAAEVCEAVNVLHKNEGRLEGHNTDVLGIEKTFEALNLDVKDKTCFMWGAGGAARAVAFVLGKLKAREVLVFNPRSNRGEVLCQQFSKIFSGTKFINIPDIKVASDIPLSLLINTTPIGMSGKASDETYFNSLSKLSFGPAAVAFDLIYTPEDTVFLKAARGCGLKTVGGLGMLIDQALASWKIWVGPLQNEKKLHSDLACFLRGLLAFKLNSKPVFLTGFMGVGKTTVAQELCDLTGRKFLDTDRLIEEASGLKIPELFEKHGEEEFRRWETKVIEDVSHTQDSIVSLGGGALTIERNLSTILDSGTLVYLEADEQTLHERITRQNLARPLLANLTETQKLEKIKSLLSARLIHYQKAHLQVPTARLNARESSFEIINYFGRSP